KKKVVGKFVEYYGPGLSNLSLADRATIANMSPEYGATMGFFPVDAETLNYLRLTGRGEEHVALVEAYTKAQGLFRTDDTPDPHFTDTIELDLDTVEPSLAGPRRPQDRVPLRASSTMFKESLREVLDRSALLSGSNSGGLVPDVSTGAELSTAVLPETLDDLVGTPVPVTMDGETFELRHGSVVIAAITSCTNTSNPSVMLAAGLLARKARQKGLQSRPWVKTSLAPGSRVVKDYLDKAGLQEDLNALGFQIVGYGCTTCIANSGPLPDAVANAIEEHKLVVASVLSGNRNFEGRINPLTRF